MNNDRELLELAAKAAEIKISQWSNAQAGGFLPGGRGDFWNPLTDDGDALRLAVKLKIDTNHYDHHAEVLFDGGYISTGTDEYSFDPYATTRRAIVRAAAEIGKEMK